MASSVFHIRQCFLWCPAIAVVELHLPKEFERATGITRRTQWTNNHAVAHLRDKTDPHTWCKSGSYSVRKNFGAPQEFPTGQYCCTSTGQDGSIKLEMARIDQEIAEVQRLDEFGYPTEIRTMAQWAYDHAIAHLQANTGPWNFRWCKWAQWLQHPQELRLESNEILGMSKRLSSLRSIFPQTPDTLGWTDKI